MLLAWSVVQARQCVLTHLPGCRDSRWTRWVATNIMYMTVTTIAWWWYPWEGILIYWQMLKIHYCATTLLWSNERCEIAQFIFNHSCMPIRWFLTHWSSSLFRDVLIIKSLQSGVTLWFQFVSAAASAAATAMTFASHVKTVWARP